jgi:excinuclease ABC subunit C
MAVPGIGRRTADAVQAAIADPAADDAAATDAGGASEPEIESTTAPQGRAERGTPRAGAGDTAEVGRVAS